jgi:eukaryotic-like serine/threonine-protein kinase
MTEAAEREAIAALFGEAIELPAERRRALVADAPASAQVREEVLSLLAAHERSASGSEHVDAALATALLAEAAAPEAAGRRLGPYRIVRELGRGGMGVVYLAERADGAYEHQVAVKLLPAALRSDTRSRRFLLERQILARLEHPRIARLLDGGIGEDGEPYFALEYVEGEPLTDWCDRRHLDLDDRLRLFVQVCEAVQYAHGRLIVHRDLKPSNVLVTRDGEVKLLDFGIAKLLAEERESGSTALTRLGMRPYTPGYAAPELLRGEEVTVATDVYGLGVLLHELLTGRRPQPRGGATARAGDAEAPPFAASEAVRLPVEAPTGDPADPAAADELVLHRANSIERLERRLAGDLDTIVSKALRAEPENRYQSVQELSEDVRRHLAGRPISARPASVRYRAGKFLRRHRVAVVTAALIVLTVLAGLAGTAWQATVATREREVARAEAAKAEQVAAFLTEVFRLSDPLRSKGEEVTVREALARGAERIHTDLAGQPVVQAELMAVIGGTYLELGDLDRADQLLTAALELRRVHLGPAHPDVADSLRNVGSLLYQRGEYLPAEELFLEAVEILERSLDPEALELGGVLNNLGILYGRTGEFDKGVAAYERALAIREHHLGPDAVDVGRVSLNLGTILSLMREDVRALAAYERALAIYQRELGPDHPYVAGTLGNISYIRMRRGEYDGLEELIQRMLAIHRKAYGPVHDRVGTGLKILGELYAATGREREAIEAYQQAIEVNRAALGEDHPNVGYPLHDLADLHLDAGRPAEALPYFRQAAAVRAAAFAEDHPLVALSLEGLGRAEEAVGDLVRAEATLRRVLALRRLPVEPDVERIAATAVRLSGVLADQARCEEALPLLAEAAAILASAAEPDGDVGGRLDDLSRRCPAAD